MQVIWNDFSLDGQFQSLDNDFTEYFKKNCAQFWIWPIRKAYPF